MASLQTLARRVAWVLGLVVHTLRALAVAGLVGVVALGAAILRAGDTTDDALVFAAVVCGAGLIVPFMLGRFAHDLGPARNLASLSPADLRRAATTLGAGLRAGERSFVEARGLGRVVNLGRALWDLRADVETLNAAGLAPAAALVTTMIPTRLIRVGIAALVAPALLALGLAALLVALLAA
jgi:hypothetical protein